MLDSILVVHQNSVPERDAEYNDWYTSVHIRDAMRLAGALAVRRFRAHACQVARHGVAQQPAQRYFTLYECSDQEAIIDGHLRYARTERMPISTAGDLRDSYAYFFRPHRMHGLPVDVPHTGCVITARFALPPEYDRSFERWFGNVHENAICHLPGVGASSLFRVAERQMAQKPPPHRYFAICGVADMAAAAHGFAEVIESQAADAPFDDVLVGCYEPLIERLTAEDVLGAGEAARAVEARAREALGERVYPRATSTFRKP